LFEIQKNPNITAEQMAEKINKTPRTAENYLANRKNLWFKFLRCVCFFAKCKLLLKPLNKIANFEKQISNDITEKF
jgi:hypothetical protein